jgi:hypothetical protein
VGFLGMGPTPQSPIPNPQSPIPICNVNKKCFIKKYNKLIIIIKKINNK